jgi:riboflavin synthase
MFTGIVEEIGTVESLLQASGGHRLRVRASKVLGDLKLGDSVAVSGTCLTVTQFDARGFTVGLSPETLRRTNLGEARSGDRVNLERALRPIDRMGGHYVQGHVDAVGTVATRERDGDALLVRVSMPESLSRYVVEKGFIAVDGVSLTVAACGEDWFSVSLIPFTQQEVTLPDRGVGARVNLEVDIMAKYAESLLTRRGGSEAVSRVTEQFLAEQGFM